MNNILNGIQETVVFDNYSIIKMNTNTDTCGYPEHWHNAIEIILPVDNEYDVSCKGAKYHLFENDILIINSGTLHQMEISGEGRRLILQIDLTQINPVTLFSTLTIDIPSVSYIPTSSLINPRLSKIIKDIYTGKYQNDNLSELRIYNKLIDFLILVADESKNMVQISNSYKKNEYETMFRNVNKYISLHYNDDLTLENIADFAGFSKYHFSRLFKAYTGETVYQYINRIRIRNAENMLSDPDLNISEIACRCGFSNISAFIRMFKINNGCTPSEYRKLYNH